MPAVSSDLLAVFNALPGACLLLSPQLVVEAVSDVFLATTLTQRHSLVGQNVFAAFPVNPNAADSEAVGTARASMEQVLATGQPHELTLQPYDLIDPARPGQFLERYWRMRNAPVVDAEGQVAHLIHEIFDITAQVQASNELRNTQVREQT
nr:hypothetical protein [Tanacetum cinerariifolium]